ncbi:hypothetical protein CTAM01_09530 [Colletotrichum tamarilloi]|uniref:Uncharacterized protein n=1 Tax=Colletotrichum tamarilloi TaxID=1209934 RepID=A0ABQ9R3E5_9PEZI|nr:uncharacterized protein CTAM01_09530 [Colletotrichum tamarilloi]KAK1493122.1 hypothetical protein CTAM01_09530 [Colletotrichum tamarilloi]
MPLPPLTHTLSHIDSCIPKLHFTHLSCVYSSVAILRSLSVLCLFSGQGPKLLNHQLRSYLLRCLSSHAHDRSVRYPFPFRSMQHSSRPLMPSNLGVCLSGFLLRCLSFWSLELFPSSLSPHGLRQIFCTTILALASSVAKWLLTS